MTTESRIKVQDTPQLPDFIAVGPGETMVKSCSDVQFRGKRHAFLRVSEYGTKHACVMRGPHARRKKSWRENPASMEALHGDEPLFHHTVHTEAD